MYFRAGPDIDYCTEIAIFCLLNNMESPATYCEKVIGVVKMVEIEESFIDELVNTQPELYVPFTRFLKTLC